MTKCFLAATRVLAAAVLVAALSPLSVVRADVLVDFNTAGVLDANFNHTATLPFSEADGVGLGGSRGIQVTGTTDSYATYKVDSLNFSTIGAKITMTAFFKTVAVIGGTGEQRILELNLVSEPNSVVTAAHTGIGGKFPFVPNTSTTLGMQFRRNNADVAGSVTGSGFAIAPSNWYKATFTATNNGYTAAIPATLVLDDYGADGSTLVTASVFNHLFDIPNTVAGANSNLSSDSHVWPAFRVRNGTRLIAAIDNFEAKLTPGAFDASSSFDGDTDVDANDFLIWQRGLGLDSQTDKSNGDANLDSFVDGADLTLWRSAFDAQSAVGAAGAVPEPATALLALAAIGALRGVARRGRLTA